MTSAHVTVEHHDGELVVIAVHGDIDLDNTRALGEEILRALPNTTMGAVLDLSDVGYLDSAAIRLLFELASTTRGHRQTLRIVVPPGSLTRARCSATSRSTQRCRSIPTQPARSLECRSRAERKRSRDARRGQAHVD